MTQYKKVLVVEDDPKRIAWFREKLRKIPVVQFVDNAKRGKKFVRENKYDFIFFDHDLGDGAFNNGFAVATTLSKTGNTDTHILIHSLNPVGANNIANVLKSAGFKNITIAPFGKFDINW
jgi:response regulator RpfG family c-di-GMP phosphodiesterase